MGDSVRSATATPTSQQADPTVTAGTRRGRPAQPASSRPAVAPSSGLPLLPPSPRTHPINPSAPCGRNNPVAVSAALSGHRRKQSEGLQGIWLRCSLTSRSLVALMRFLLHVRNLTATLRSERHRQRAAAAWGCSRREQSATAGRSTAITGSRNGAPIRAAQGRTAGMSRCAVAVHPLTDLTADCSLSPLID